MVLLVVRIKGTINIPHSMDSTLRFLNLKTKFSATLVPESPVYLGMLSKISNLVAWSRVDELVVKDLFTKKGKAMNSSFISEAEIPPEYGNIDGLVRGIVEEKVKLSDIKKIKPFFRLSPPRGGFKRKTKRQYSDGGVLGKNTELPDLIRRML
jgi:large subunit ribosomal protein L30